MFFNENDVKYNTEDDIKVKKDDLGLGNMDIHYGEYFNKSSFDIEGEVTGDTQEEIKDQTTSDDSFHESVSSYLENDDLTVDDDIELEDTVTGDTQEEIKDQTTSDDSFHESVSSYLENDDLTVDDDVTGDTQEEIKDQTTSDDSIHECGDNGCAPEDKINEKGIKLDESSVRVFPRKNINIVTESDINAVRRYYNGITVLEAVELVANAHGIDAKSIKISR